VNPPLGRYNAIRFATALVWQPFIQIQGYQDTMVESDDFVQALQDIGFDFFTGVPDSILGGIIATLMERRLYTPAVREDEAVGMAAGAFMAGKVPAVLMQNSGLGTSLNALISLNVIYQQPCLLLISWRGFQGKDAPEHLVMGDSMTQILDAARIPHRTLSEQSLIEDLKWTAQTFMKQRIPVALLLKKGIVKGNHP
jgi:sulfopyruvate decarboxylase alpha subunit